MLKFLFQKRLDASFFFIWERERQGHRKGGGAVLLLILLGNERACISDGGLLRSTRKEIPLLGLVT